MKRVLMLALALVIAVAFVSTGFAQEKPAAPEKPAATPEKPAAAAPEKPAAPEKKEAAEAPKPKPKPAGFVGEIIRADAAANLFTVKGAKDTVTFDFAGAKFKGYKSADEIKMGDKVAVKYGKEGLKVTKLGAKKAKKAKK